MNDSIQILTSSSSFTLGNENSDSHCAQSIKTFNHEQFGEIRICQTEGKEWFCLSDVCEALEINNPRDVKKRLQQRGVVTIDTPTYNQHGTMVMQPTTYIDEANLYRCIFQSRKQEAELFQSWEFEEVLPQIRRTGGYVTVTCGEKGTLRLNLKAVYITRDFSAKEFSRELSKEIVSAVNGLVEK